MVLEQIEPLFYAKGYNKIPTNSPEYAFYCHEENQGCTVIFVMDYREDTEIQPEWYARMKERGAGYFHARGEPEIHMLTLILCGDARWAKKLCGEDSFCWVIDTRTDKLIIYENQVSDFYGWRMVIEDFLSRPPYHEGGWEETAQGSGGIHREKWSREQIAKLPWVNICLVAVNVIVFLICTFTGDLLYNKGALGVKEIAADGSYYRIITSMFLHSNVQHLFSNMIILYYIGEIVEKKTGHILYAVIYFLSGTAGAVFSMGYELLMRDYYTSVGASGAVFGVEGALLMLVILYHGKLEYMTTGRLIFAIVFSLYCGLTGTNVNNAAHIGGILMGFAVMAVIAMLCPRIRAGKDEKINED